MAEKMSKHDAQTIRTKYFEQLVGFNEISEVGASVYRILIDTLEDEYFTYERKGDLFTVSITTFEGRRACHDKVTLRVV